MSEHLTHFVQQAEPIAAKASIGAGVATFLSSFTLAEWAQIVGIICSITMAVAALTFHVLNYRLNRQRVRAERGE
jgi:preprotein translocase subunit SecG